MTRRKVEPWDAAAFHAAWSAAEDEMPSWWRIRSLTEVATGWEVVAVEGGRIMSAVAPVPAAAIHALIAKLWDLPHDPIDAADRIGRA